LSMLNTKLHKFSITSRINKMENVIV